MHHRSLTAHFNDINTEIGDADVALIWAAGDLGWNEETGGVFIITSAVNFTAATLVSVTSFLDGYSYTDNGTEISLNTLSLDPNFAGGYALAPIYEPDLLGRWAHVVALGINNSDVIADFSNGCGNISKYWCLAAPGTGIRDLPSPFGNYTDDSGVSSTALAASYVSGALAVLRSRLPSMPMSVVLAVLFNTATDLGAPGVDDVYGHGFLNLSAAVNLQGNVSLIVPVDPVGTIVSIIVSLSLPTPNAITGTFDTSNAEFALNHGLQQIGAHKAYERGYFGQNVTVGVIDDTGVDTTHTDLAANIISGQETADTGGLIASPSITPDGPRGTFIAGVIGAQRDDVLIQGVAPQASIMPLQFSQRSTVRLRYADENYLPLLHYGATASIHVLNNSWSASVYENYGVGFFGGGHAIVPYMLPAAGEAGNVSIFLDGALSSYTNMFSDIAATVGASDVALIWAAGDGGWHEGGSVNYTVSAGSLPSTTNIDQYITNVHSFFHSGNFDHVDFGYTIISRSVVEDIIMPYNSPAAYAPTYEQSLIGRWAHVIAVDSNNDIYGFSNGCGDVSRYWCLAAPGVNISGIVDNSDTALTTRSGTDVAAGHVSGALAVLKSRLPNMPMSIVLAILFETATDLGDTGVDEVYGHGLVNLEKAITLQGNLSLIVPVDFSMAGTIVSVVVGEIMVTGAASTVTNFSDLTVTSTVGETYLSLSLPVPNAITGTYDTTNTEFASNYGLQQIGAHKAYERGYFGQNVVPAMEKSTGTIKERLPCKVIAFSKFTKPCPYTSSTPVSPKSVAVSNNIAKTILIGILGRRLFSTAKAPDT